MKIYDIDKDLNRLLNAPGMNDALKKFGCRTILWWFVEDIPVGLLVLATWVVFYIFQTDIIIIIPCLILCIGILFVGSCKLKDYIYSKKMKYLTDINICLGNIFDKCRYKYNWEELVLILNERIWQKEHQNDVFKKSVTITLSLLGVKTILIDSSKIWRLISNISKPNHDNAIFALLAVTATLLWGVSIFVKFYDCWANNYVGLEKWHVLLNHAAKFKIRSKRSRN